jgi:hypothetical protein
MIGIDTFTTAADERWPGGTMAAEIAFALSPVYGQLMREPIIDRTRDAWAHLHLSPVS